MPISITYWRDVLRKLTTTEMDNNFENLVNAIADAGLSPTMPEGQIYIGDNTNNAILDTLDTSIVPETTNKNYQTDNQKLFNDATSSIQTQIDSKEPTIASGTTSQYWRGDKTWQTFPTISVPTLDEVTDVGNTTTNSIEVGGLVVDMPSGSGVAVNITKGGNEEGLKVHKTSGSGNVATITGGTTLISELELTTPLADAEIASASTWNAKLGTSGGTLTGALNYAPSVTIASATTTDIGNANSNNIIISGTTTITSFGTVAEGVVRTIRFSGALTLTNNATSLILPNGTNITTQNGDTAIFRSLGSGNWICISYKSVTALSNNYLPYWDGSKFVNSSLRRGVTSSITGNVSSVSIIGSFTVLTAGTEANNNFYEITRDGSGTLTIYSNADWRQIKVQSGIVYGVEVYGNNVLLNYNNSCVNWNGAGLAIGVNRATTANASAQLDLQATNKGFLPNRMTNAQRTAISSPAIGLMVYCTDATEGLYIYKSTGWTFII